MYFYYNKWSIPARVRITRLLYRLLEYPRKYEYYWNIYEITIVKMRSHIWLNI